MKNKKHKKCIAFNGLIFDGAKHQEKLFKIFDLIDEMFSDKEKEKMTINFDYSTIKNFDIHSKDVPEGSTKRNFALVIAKHNKPV